ncbi:MAG: site-specific DNA-methyltransferase [Planctomycetota bacterium]
MSRRVSTGSGEAARTAGGSRLAPEYHTSSPDTTLFVGDCREVLPAAVEPGSVDLIFADPPFNWSRDYDRHEAGGAWDDRMAERVYCDVNQSFTTVMGDAGAFTQQWLDLCIEALAPHGALWVNIPDTWAAEIVVHLKQRGLTMMNWCIWHYRFGQNTLGRFINSKVHALYFVKDADAGRRWNTDAILEPSDRATTYADPRTQNKKEGKNGWRVPLDVWYGKWWGRIQGNNKERRAQHDNQIPEVYLERVVRACSNEGDLVLDPFCGSGTTSTVARALGRRSITIEYSPANAETAWERITMGPLRVTKDQPTVHVNPLFQGRSRRSAVNSTNGDG